MKSAKHILQIIIALCLVLTLSGCSLQPADLAEGASTVFDIVTGRYEVPADKVKEQMLERLTSYATTMEFRHVSPETANQVYGEIISEHPELFWLNSAYRYAVTTYRSGATDIYMEVLLKTGTEDIPAMNEKYQAAVKSIVSRVDSSWSDYEKALFIHDYITENCSYDIELSEKLTASTDEDLLDCEQLGTSAYGCLVDNLAICSGYANAFQALMHELGIQCGKTRGQIEEDGVSNGHVWNFITLDGENYFVDVTWDDSGENPDEPAPPDHSYFCITGEELYSSHRLNDDEADPVCTATKYNYHIASGYYLESYDFSSVSSIIDAQSGKELIELKFASQEALDKACNDLFGYRRIFEIPSVGSHGYCTVWHRSCSDSHVLSIWIDNQ